MVTSEEEHVEDDIPDEWILLINIFFYMRNLLTLSKLAFLGVISKDKVTYDVPWVAK